MGTGSTEFLLLKSHLGPAPKQRITEARTIGFGLLWAPVCLHSASVLCCIVNNQSLYFPRILSDLEGRGHVLVTTCYRKQDFTGFSPSRDIF